MNYITRQSSGWFAITSYWYRTDIYTLSQQQRKWIECNIRGRWTENAFGCVMFEHEDDYILYMFAGS